LFIASYPAGLGWIGLARDRRRLSRCRRRGLDRLGAFLTTDKREGSARKQGAGQKKPADIH